MSRYKAALLDIIQDRPIAYHPKLARHVGGVKAAVMLSQLLYWNGGKTAQERGGWFYKSVDEMEEETGLTKLEQQTAREELRKCGAIECELKGLPRVWWYRVDLDRLAEILAPEQAEESTGDNSHWVANPPNVGKETHPILDSKPSQLNQEITQEITNNIDDDFSELSRPLLNAFLEASKQPIGFDPTRWHNPLIEMAKAGVNADDVKAAVKTLYEKKYSVHSPQSIQRTAINLMGARKAAEQPKTVNGSPTAGTLIIIDPTRRY